MRKLEFIGTVQANKQELVIPGREDLFLKPEDWPRQLAPGLLNVGINDFPDGFDEIGKGDRLDRLDEGKFRAALVIPQRMIASSTLKPDADHPTRGFAQVWRAEIQVVATGQTTRCWALRVIGSDARRQMDLVAEEDLRSRLKLCDGMAVKVTVWEAEAKWKPKTPKEIIADWCEAARGVEEGLGPEKAMGYLIGEKFLNFLEVAETDRDWREAIPAFVAEIQALFEPWQIADYLNTPRRLGALGHVASEEAHRMFREELEEEQRVREDARNLMVLEWAKELLLEEGGDT
jgi:hypothetical protein